ncbi:MAG: PAS domain-containing protein [Planctomycetaceae bacterium]|nr:PAS domain-containing protein [Planctomycetaceae bacterium]
MRRFFFALPKVSLIGIFLPTFFLGTLWGDPLQAQNPLGPGVLTTVTPDINYDETYTRHAAVELLGKSDKAPVGNVVFDRTHWADDIRFSRDIWCLEFQYKPIRTLWVDIPTKNGIERKLVLYMVYAVTNAGEKSAVRSTVEREIEFPEFKTVEIPNCTCEFCKQAGNREGSVIIEVNTPPILRNQPGPFKPEPFEMPIQFAPQFILASDRILENAKTEVDPKTGDITTEVQRTKAVFHDQIIPVAIDAISKREKAEKPFESTVSIAGKTIQPNETVWGVATWVDVDPRINFFSVSVVGLTNAYKWERDEKYVYKKGDEVGSGRELTRKVLKLNFSRPGDEFDMNDRQFRIGIQGELDFEWVYQ